MPEHTGEAEIKNNGGLKKTVEEIEVEKQAAADKLKKEREERFYKDPDSFVEMKELIIGAINTTDGVAVYVGKGTPRHLLEIAQSRMNFVITEQFMVMKVAAMKKAQGRIINPNQKPRGGFGNPFKRK